jgi:DNA recombination protein RmuC
MLPVSSMVELNARIQTMGDSRRVAATRHERLDAVTERLGESCRPPPRIRRITCSNHRPSVIDTAQKNITDLESQMTSLQAVLASKQQRGAFGQSRMEVIIQDGLPKGCYDFQFTLSNECVPIAAS